MIILIKIVFSIILAHSSCNLNHFHVLNSFKYVKCSFDCAKFAPGKLKDFQMSRFTWGQTSLIHFASCRHAQNELSLLKNNGHIANSR